MAYKRIPHVDLPPYGHFVGGFFATFLASKYPEGTRYLFAGFFAYELVQFYCLHDKAWKDIGEFVIGLFAGAISRYLLDLLGFPWL